MQVKIDFLGYKFEFLLQQQVNHLMNNIVQRSFHSHKAIKSRFLLLRI